MKTSIEKLVAFLIEHGFGSRKFVSFLVVVLLVCAGALLSRSVGMSEHHFETAVDGLIVALAIYNGSNVGAKVAANRAGTPAPDAANTERAE